MNNNQQGKPGSLTSTAFNTGVIMERERIVKLLEADCKDGLGDQIQGCSHEVAIALIKGENK